MFFKGFKIIRKTEESEVSNENIPGDLLEKLRIAEKVLKEIKVRGYDVDLISSGVAQRLRISKDGKKLIVFVDFSGANPHCLFCKVLEESLWKDFISRARETLKKEGFEEVIFVDLLTGGEVFKE